MRSFNEYNPGNNLFFNPVINTNSSETKVTNYETVFSNYPTFNWFMIIEMN